VLEAINEALALPKADMPHVPRHQQAPEGTAAAAELLKVLLKLIAEKHGVAPKVIANSEDLDKIAAEGEKAEVAALTGWRRDLFGETALQLIQGQVALRFVGKRVETVNL
jgi:ribonuclease D